MPNKDQLWRDNNYQPGLSSLQQSVSRLYCLFRLIFLPNSKVIAWLKGNVKVEETLVLTFIIPILTSHLTVIVMAPVRVWERTIHFRPVIPIKPNMEKRIFCGL